MNIYDEGIFVSHLDIEIAKSERFGYPFSVIAVKTLNPQMHSNILLTSIIQADYRACDLVAKLDGGIYILLLNGTTEENSQKYMGRLIQKAVSENEIPIMASVVTYKNGDTRKMILERLLKKIQ